MSNASSFSAAPHCLGFIFYFLFSFFYSCILYFLILDIFLWQGFVVGGHATLCHLYARTGLRSGRIDSLRGFGLVNGDNSSGMTRTEDVRRLLPDAPDAPEMRTVCGDFVIDACGAGMVRVMDAVA